MGAVPRAVSVSPSPAGPRHWRRAAPCSGSNPGPHPYDSPLPHRSPPVAGSRWSRRALLHLETQITAGSQEEEPVLSFPRSSETYETPHRGAMGEESVRPAARLRPRQEASVTHSPRESALTGWTRGPQAGGGGGGAHLFPCSAASCPEPHQGHSASEFVSRADRAVTFRWSRGVPNGHTSQ